MTAPLLPNPYREDLLLEAMLECAERFIGLGDELEDLVARVTQERPAAVSLVAPRGMGKSFMLRCLAHPEGGLRLFSRAVGRAFADEPERLLFVPLDLSGGLTGTASLSLLRQLYEELLVQLGRLLKVDDVTLLPLERMPSGRVSSLGDLRERAQRAIAAAREEADDDELRQRFTSELGATMPGGLIELLRRIDAWGLRAVFLLDEFDTIAARLSREEYDNLRAVLAVASMVIASTRALSEQVPAEVQTSPFFNLLQRLTILSLRFLSPEDARRLVLEPPTWVAGMQFRFTEADADFILELTGLHPDLIRETCEYLYRTRYRSYRAGQDVLPEAERPYVRALLQPLFADFFAGLWHELSEHDRRTLRLIAAGELADEPISPELVARGYIVFEGGRQRLFAGLFRDFVLVQGASPQAAQRGAPAAEVELPPLTELEQRLLDLLLERAGEVVRRDTIIAALYDDVVDPREARGRLDALVFRLRSKLEGEPLLIESVRGQGYRLIRRAGP